MLVFLLPSISALAEADFHAEDKRAQVATREHYPMGPTHQNYPPISQSLPLNKAISDSNTTWISSLLGDPCYTVYLQGVMAYFGNNDFLDIASVENSDEPVSLGSIRFPDSVRGVAVNGSRAYVTNGYPGFFVIDISDLSAPAEIGNFDTAGWASGVAINGDFAYLGDGSRGLLILDISDPNNPEKVGEFNTGGFAYDVKVVGDLAYVADWDGGLRIFDVSDPSAPSEKGDFYIGGNVRSVTVDTNNNLAYLANGYLGLRILDVSNPASPVEVGFIDTDDFAHWVAVDDIYVYVADWHNGLRIFDVSNPAVPFERAYYSNGGYASSVAVNELLAYVADNSGLHIVRHDLFASNIQDSIGYSLNLSNYPNPFNPITTIRFELLQATVVGLSIFDMSGRQIRRLVCEEYLEMGGHRKIWYGDDDSGRQMPSGVYFYRLEAGNFTETKRMVFLK